MLCDTHCHLDSSKYDEDFNETLERANAANIGYFVIPAAHPDDLEKAAKLAEQHERVFFATGMHPDAAHLWDEKFVKSFVNHPKCVAIGECGLDYYRVDEKIGEMGFADFSEMKEAQKRVFAAQIDLAAEAQKPLIVHIREASLDSYEILREAAPRLCGGILHCFNAAQELLKLAPLGFYYGIGGVSTFKNARKLIEILPKIPLNRIVLETDAPYLTPEPHRGERNEPAYVSLVLEKISQILEQPKDALSAQIAENTNALFGKYFFCA